MLEKVYVVKIEVHVDNWCFLMKSLAFGSTTMWEQNWGMNIYLNGPWNPGKEFDVAQECGWRYLGIGVKLSFKELLDISVSPWSKLWQIWVLKVDNKIEDRGQKRCPPYSETQKYCSSYNNLWWDQNKRDGNKEMTYFWAILPLVYGPAPRHCKSPVRIRNRDPRVTRKVRYQLSYRAIC